MNDANLHDDSEIATVETGILQHAIHTGGTMRTQEHKSGWAGTGAAIGWTLSALAHGDDLSTIAVGAAVVALMTVVLVAIIPNHAAERFADVDALARGHHVGIDGVDNATSTYNGATRPRDIFLSPRRVGDELSRGPLGLD